MALTLCSLTQSFLLVFSKQAVEVSVQSPLVQAPKIAWLHRSFVRSRQRRRAKGALTTANVGLEAEIGWSQRVCVSAYRSRLFQLVVPHRKSLIIKGLASKKHAGVCASLCSTRRNIQGTK